MSSCRSAMTTFAPRAASSRADAAPIPACRGGRPGSVVFLAPPGHGLGTRQLADRDRRLVQVGGRDRGERVERRGEPHPEADHELAVLVGRGRVDQARVGGAVRLHEPGALGERVVAAGHRVDRRGHHRRLDLRRQPRRVRRLEQRADAGDVRRRHRGARDQVPVTPEVERRGDPSPGAAARGGEVRLEDGTVGGERGAPGRHPADRAMGVRIHVRGDLCARHQLVARAQRVRKGHTMVVRRHRTAAPSARATGTDAGTARTTVPRNRRPPAWWRWHRRPRCRTSPPSRP